MSSVTLNSDASALLSDGDVTAALEAVDKESKNGELVRQFLTALKTAEKSCRPIPDNA